MKSGAVARPSITRRLTWLFALISSGVLVVLGAATLLAIDSHFKAQDRDTLGRHLRQLQLLVADVDGPERFAQLPDQLELAFSSHDDLALNVATDAGRVLFHQHLPKAPWRAEQTGGVAALGPLAYWEGGGKTWIGTVVRMDTGLQGQAPLQVSLGLDVHHHDAFMRSFRHVLIGYVLIAALGSAMAGWWVVRRGLRPLTALRDQAAQVQFDQLSVRMPEDRVPVELVELTITLNQMLTRLEDAFEHLSQFSSDIAHELRTPISNLMTQTQVTLSQVRDAQTYKETLASNAEELERLARTVSDMLYLAKADNGLLLPSREPIQVHAEVQALFDFYEALAMDGKVSLRLDGVATVMGDRLMLRRAIGNLLSNALRHTPAGGTVHVGVFTAAGRVHVTVRNDGVPISDKALPHLFDRFYRAQKDRHHPRGDSDGAGLGLAIVKAIAKSHGGEIAVQALPAANVFDLSLPTA